MFKKRPRAFPLSSHPLSIGNKQVKIFKNQPESVRVSIIHIKIFQLNISSIFYNGPIQTSLVYKCGKRIEERVSLGKTHKDRTANVSEILLEHQCLACLQEINISKKIYEMTKNIFEICDSETISDRFLKLNHVALVQRIEK